MDNNSDIVSWSVSVLDTKHYTVPRWAAFEGRGQRTHRGSVSVVQGTDKESCIYLSPAPVAGTANYTDRLLERVAVVAGTVNYTDRLLEQAVAGLGREKRIDSPWEEE